MLNVSGAVIQVRVRLFRGAVDRQRDLVVRVRRRGFLSRDPQVVRERRLTTGLDCNRLTQRVGVRRAVSVKPRVTNARTRVRAVGVNDAGR